MNKKICAITGCNTGIGKQVALQLAMMGYEILMLVRDSEKSIKARDYIATTSNNNNIHTFFVDLMDLASLVKVVEEIKSKYSNIDVLINNAGVIKRSAIVGYDGYESTLIVNYFAPVVLTNLMLPLLINSNQGRIINLCSELYKNGQPKIEKYSETISFNGNKVYGTSKLLILLFTKELARKLKNTNVTVNAIHPGVVGTEVFREYPKLFNAFLNMLISKPEKGAKPVVYLASSKELANVSGEYFVKSKLSKTTAIVDNEYLWKQIWTEMELALGPMGKFMV